MARFTNTRRAFLRPPMPLMIEDRADPDAVRKLVDSALQVWGVSPTAIYKPANATRVGFHGWLARDKKFEQRQDWIGHIADAAAHAIREKAWEYLEAWDPDGVGRFRTGFAQAQEQRRQELEARLSAIRAGAEFLDDIPPADAA